MLKNKMLRALPVAGLGLAIALSPVSAIRAAGIADGSITLTSPVLQNAEPVTIYGLAGGIVPSYDPQRATDEVSIAPIENLFLGLADVDPQTAEIRPELATEWTVSDDGTVWTFTIRDDVPWVKHTPGTDETVEVRKVTAGDIEYGIKRICDPRIGSTYTPVAASVLKGCDVVSALDASAIQDSDFDQIAVTAKDDTTLEITTSGAYSYFESMLTFWFFRPVPREVIDEFGEQWTEPANIVTNGPFVLDKYDANVERIYLKNPLYVEVNDSYGGNVEKIQQIEVADATSALSLYEEGQIDAVGVPRAELTRIREDAELSQQLQAKTDVNVYFFRFAFDKAPMDQPEVRRALAAVVDRSSFVSEIRGGAGVPMAHLVPPGAFGAVPINEVGVGSPDNIGFDPEFAKEQMAAAGYPNCEGFPEIRVITYQGAANWAEFLQNGMSTHLGCDTSKITVEELEFSVLLQSILATVPTEQRPHIWTLGWGADYPDAHNFFFDAGIACRAANESKRPCTEVDEKIDQASKEQDSEVRAQLYREIEEAWFGPEGEQPLIPIFSRVVYTLYQPWYTGFFEIDATFGGPHWQTRQIDQEAQLAARGGAGVPLVAPTLAPTEEATSSM